MYMKGSLGNCCCYFFAGVGRTHMVYSTQHKPEQKTRKVHVCIINSTYHFHYSDADPTQIKAISMVSRKGVLTYKSQDMYVSSWLDVRVFLNLKDEKVLKKGS